MQTRTIRPRKLRSPCGVHPLRNVDAERSLTITSVRYYDTDGKLQRNWLQKPLQLGPLATMEFLVDEHDVTGGSGANFIVDFTAPAHTAAPVTEAVMIGGASNRALSFVSRGVRVNVATEGSTGP